MHYYNMRDYPDNNGGYYPIHEGFGYSDFRDMHPVLKALLIATGIILAIFLVGVAITGVSIAMFWERIRNLGFVNTLKTTFQALIARAPLPDGFKVSMLGNPIFSLLIVGGLLTAGIMWYTASPTPIFNMVQRQESLPIAWKNAGAAAYLPIAIQLYGEPDFIEYGAGGMAIWNAQKLQQHGMPFVEVRLCDDDVAHCFPTSHSDFLKATIHYELSGADCTGYPIGMRKVLRANGSLTYDPEKRWLSAKCNSHGNVVAMLVLGTRINSGQVTLALAQDMEMFNKMLIKMQAEPTALTSLMAELEHAVQTNVETQGPGIRGDTAKLIPVDVPPMDELGIGCTSIFGDKAVDYYTGIYTNDGKVVPPIVPYDASNDPSQYLYLHIKGIQPN